ncbi:unnamed protein product [Choristocarpus tenellus]
MGRYVVEIRTVKVRGHYFENGNIQLQTTKEVQEVTVEFEGPASLAEAVVKRLAEVEGELHEGLEDTYDKMGSVTLRNMRRTKPITADRFSWNIAHIRMRNTLTQSSSK